MRKSRKSRIAHVRERQRAVWSVGRSRPRARARALRGFIDNARTHSHMSGTNNKTNDHCNYTRTPKRRSQTRPVMTRRHANFVTVLDTHTHTHPNPYPPHSIVVHCAPPPPPPSWPSTSPSATPCYFRIDLERPQCWRARAHVFRVRTQSA